MHIDESNRVPFARRAGAALDKAEHVYLRVLRAGILIIATVLLIYAAWLALSSIYKLSRSPDSVVEKVASVQADELTSAELPAVSKTADPSGTPVVNPEHRAFYKAFVQNYFDLYRTRFERFRKPEDKQLVLGEFDDSFLSTPERLDAVTKGELNFAEDKADLESLLAVMTEAAERPATQERLSKYRSAKKVPVQRQVERTRTTYRQGWDSYATNCAYWYDSPVGCSVTRPIQTSFTQTVTEMQYPKGTQSHTQIFRAFQDRYFQLLQERRDANAAEAENERQTILAGFVDGKISLMTALQILGGFLLLMFFFLLIAIERHQRRLAGDINTRG